MLKLLLIPAVLTCAGRAYGEIMTIAWQLIGGGNDFNWSALVVFHRQVVAWVN
jgi:hypothetical protein